MKRTILSIDTETLDPNLLTLGPGCYRKDGHILGFSYADDLGNKEYLDLGHIGITESVRNKNLAKVKELLADPCPKLGANIQYDCKWLGHWLGVDIEGQLIDIQQAEALLDEYRTSYSLDSLAETYLGVHKEKDEIQEFCDTHGLKGDPRKWLYQMPYALVRKYAIADVTLPLAIWEKQKKLLEEQDLLPLFEIESGILPVLLQMSKNGIRIDEKKRALVATEHESELESRTRAWQSKYGNVNYNSTQQVAELFDRYGVPYGLSNGGKKELLSRLNTSMDDKRLAMVDELPLFVELGMKEAEQIEFRKKYPSITKDLLDEIAEDYPIAREVEELKRIDKVLNTFINGTLVRFVSDGRAHPSIHPTSSDEGGCRTGRMSSSQFNSQQIPSPKGGFDPKVRDCFIPEEGEWWGKCDYSQIEIRAFLHFAKGPRADEVRQLYIDNPKMDYYNIAKEWTSLDRTTSKRLTLGILYFQGPKSMSKRFHWKFEHAQELHQQYMESIPFMGPTRDAVVAVAKQRGYIRTMLGRRCRMSPSIKKAKKEYIAFNSLLQGTCADLMKKAIYDINKAGIFKILTPLNVVHDDLSVSVPKTKEGLEAYRELKHCMEIAMKFRIPILAEAEIGDNWGNGEPCTFKELD